MAETAWAIFYCSVSMMSMQKARSKKEKPKNCRTLKFACGSSISFARFKPIPCAAIPRPFAEGCRWTRYVVNEIARAGNVRTPTASIPHKQCIVCAGCPAKCRGGACHIQDRVGRARSVRAPTRPVPRNDLAVRAGCFAERRRRTRHSAQIFDGAGRVRAPV